MWEVTTGCESCAMEGARLRCPWAAAGPAGQHTATSRTDVEGTARPAGPGRTTHRHPDRLEAAARRPEICRGHKQKQKDRRPPAHQAARSAEQRTRRPQHPWGRNTTQQLVSPTRRVGITKPPGPTGAGRLSQYQRLIAGSRRCRGLRGRSPGERWKCRAWRQRPSRFPPCGDPHRRRWRPAWPSRQRSRRRCPRSRPG